MDSENTVYQNQGSMTPPPAPVAYNQTANAQQGSGTWKFVTIGSAVGILLGAGAVFATKAVAQNPEKNESADAENDEKDTDMALEGLTEAHVSDDLSFAEAFEEAREEVGPGGFFKWHGGIYGTYTRDEWDSMSDEEKNAFMEKVGPEYTAEYVDTAHLSEHTPEVQVVHVHEHIHVNEPHVYTAGTHTASTNEDVVINEDDDVRVLGTTEVQGHAAVVLDMNSDDNADAAVIDMDDSGSLTDPDVVLFADGTATTIGELRGGTYTADAGSTREVSYVSNDESDYTQAETAAATTIEVGDYAPAEDYTQPDTYTQPETIITQPETITPVETIETDPSIHYVDTTIDSFSGMDDYTAGADDAMMDGLV